MIKENYVECLVKAKKSVGFLILKIVLIVLCVISLMLFFVTPWATTVALVLGLCAYMINTFVHVEYEYLYVDRDLVVDKILNQKTRRRMGTYALAKMEILAPINSHHLDSYRNREAKEKDYSIGVELKPDLRYVMYYEGNQKLILSPSEEIIEAMKYMAPRKVFTD